MYYYEVLKINTKITVQTKIPTRKKYSFQPHQITGDLF